MANSNFEQPHILQTPGGNMNNSHPEMANLQFLWLCLEVILLDLAHKHTTLLSGHKNGLTKLYIAAQLVRALALHLNIKQTCPLTPVHIPGVENAVTDIPSCSFGSVKERGCKSDGKLPLFFKKKSPYPNRPPEQSSTLVQK
jgi:hypothetical protein